jgi:simple sugar transport system permease protein
MEDQKMSDTEKSFDSPRFMRRFLEYREIGGIIGLILISAVFAIFSKEFLSIPTFAAILTVTAELGVVAIGAAFLIICGEFDLSVGSIFAVASMAFAILLNAGVAPVLALILTLAVATAMGFINGYITLKTGIPSFIATLGTMMFWRGVLLAVTGGFTISIKGESLLITLISERFLGDFTTSALWLILLTVVFEIVLSGTQYGNWVYATGGNTGVARAMGVNVERVKLINFMICGFLAGFGGCISLARFKLVDPTLGMGMELEAITAAVIGGTLLTGGYGSIVGTFIGAVLIGMIRTGLILAGAPAYWYRAFIGIVLVIAAVINIKIKKRVAG